MSTSPTRSAARCAPSRARCWWWTPARASRRRRWPTSIRRIDAGHEIVPVLNKIDLPAAEPERVKENIEEVIGIDASGRDPDLAPRSGLGIPDVLEAIVTRLPAPKGDRDAPLKAMLVDSWYDAYLGVVVMIRVMDGVIRKGDQIKMMQTGASLPHRQAGRAEAADGRHRRTGAGRDRRLHRARSSRSATRAWATPSRTKAQAADRAAGLQTRAARGLLRPLPGRRQRFRGPARRHREARAQRRLLQLRDGDLGRPRLRLPLRLPGPSASRGRSATGWNANTTWT